MAAVAVKRDGILLAGFIDNGGSCVIAPTFPIDSELLRESTHFSEGIAFLPSRSSYDYKVAIDHDGAELFEIHALAILPMMDGRAAFADHRGKWGYIDDQGNVAIEPTYTRAGNFRDGRAVVSKDRSSFLELE